MLMTIDECKITQVVNVEHAMILFAQHHHFAACNLTSSHWIFKCTQSDHTFFTLFFFFPVFPQQTNTDSDRVAVNSTLSRYNSYCSMIDCICLQLFLHYLLRSITVEFGFSSPAIWTVTLCGSYLSEEFTLHNWPSVRKICTFEWVKWNFRQFLRYNFNSYSIAPKTTVKLK